MSAAVNLRVTYQTTAIVITIPVRGDSDVIEPNVSATRTRVLIDGDGNVFSVGPSETRVLARVQEDAAYGAVMAAFSRNIDAAFPDQPSIVTQ
ncbi:MAG: hypothetical protein EBR82_82545 [Caulobacteraceae bacterium]|nr:hypothetical protein [Caulobacteraceae bacterium]